MREEPASSGDGRGLRGPRKSGLRQADLALTSWLPFLFVFYRCKVSLSAVLNSGFLDEVSVE